MKNGDALGFGWSDALHPEDKERILADWEVCLKEAVGYDGEFRFMKPSGEVTWTHTQTAPVFSAEGEVVYHVGTNEDITDRKQAEDALKESEKQHRFISENIADIVWTLDMDLNTIYVSPSVEAILGFTQEERMRQSLEEMLPAESLRKAQDMLAKELVADDDETSEPDRHVNIELEYYHKDGHLVWTESVVKAIRDGEGNIVGLLGVSRDITERRKAEAALRESEERFRLMFDHSEALISLVDENADTHYANPAWRAMFGKPTDAQDPLGLVHPDDRERVGDAWRAFRSGIKDLTDLRYRVLLPDNGVKHFETSAKRADIEGKKLHFVFAHDITHRKREEEQREMLEAKFRQSQKMEALGTLAGGISHDFNNILGIIMGNTDLALRDVPDWNPARDCLNEIRVASLRARDIVQQILSFSRQSLYEYHPIRVTPVVQDTLRLLRSSMPASIDIEQHVETDDDVALADQGQINQIVMNLCTNSAQAMPTGGKLKIRLTTAHRLQLQGVSLAGKPADRYIRLTIEDTGTGIDPSIMDRILEPYFTTKEMGKGTGMGLAVVEGIVRKHNGAIRFDSSPGKGTTVDVYLPLIDEEPSDAAEKTPSNGAGTEQILFVDDEPGLVDTYSALLREMGYRVVTCTHPETALGIFGDRYAEIDLVITDMTMPGMNGDELTRRLSRIKPGIPVILCSGYSDLFTDEQAREIGISAFAIKPIEVDDIARTIRSLLS